MQQIVVRVDQDQKLLLESLAQKQNVTVSHLAREAFKLILNPKKSKKKNYNSLLELAQIGKKNPKIKGPADLSATYKKILYK